MATTASRTPHEVFKRHSKAMASRDLEAIVSDYADDARFVTNAGVLRGKDGVRKGFRKIFADLPEPAWNVRTRVLDGDVLFLEWTAEADGSRANGVETFLVRDGEIVLQTVHYTAVR